MKTSTRKSIARAQDSDKDEIDDKIELQRLDSKETMEEKIFEIFKTCHILLLIDNLEDVLREDKDDLREFLDKVFSKSPKVNILTSSRDNVIDLE